MGKTVNPGHLTAQFTRLLNAVIGGTLADYYANRRQEEAASLEGLSYGGREISDPAGSQERLTDRMVAVGILEELGRAFPKEKSPEQWRLFQAALEVTRHGVDPAEPRSFYDAVFRWLEENHPETGIRRESVRIYWHYLCKSLKQVAWREGVGL